MFWTLPVLVSLCCLCEHEAAAATLGDFALKVGETALAQPAAPIVREPVSQAVAVTLAIVPGFGLGHFYAYDDLRGLTFLVLDGTVTAFGISTFVLYVLSVAPGYTKVALIMIPVIWATVKVVEVVDVVDAVEVANNRTFKPALSGIEGPASLRHVSESAGMITVARF